jgi:hypothetical protein
VCKGHADRKQDILDDIIDIVGTPQQQRDLGVLLAEQVITHAKEKYAETEIKQDPAVEPCEIMVEEMNTWNTRQGI